MQLVRVLVSSSRDLAALVTTAINTSASDARIDKHVVRIFFSKIPAGQVLTKFCACLVKHSIKAFAHGDVPFADGLIELRFIQQTFEERVR
jgi:hypothetical protein